MSYDPSDDEPVFRSRSAYDPYKPLHIGIVVPDDVTEYDAEECVR